MNLLAAAVCEVSCGQGSGQILHEITPVSVGLVRADRFRLMRHSVRRFNRKFWFSSTETLWNHWTHIFTHWPIAEKVNSSNSQQQTYSYLSFFFILNAMNQKENREKKHSRNHSSLRFNPDDFNLNEALAYTANVRLILKYGAEASNLEMEWRKEKPKVRTIQTKRRHDNIQNRIRTNRAYTTHKCPAT